MSFQRVGRNKILELEILPSLIFGFHSFFTSFSLFRYGALSSTSAPHDDFSYAWNDVSNSGVGAAEDE